MNINARQRDPNGFVIERFNQQPAFSSFLPGIAGTQGRPAWVFYTNRGQGVASFGVRNKDGAFLEFFPADKAYQLTQSRGFRTFIKIDDGDERIRYEPFRYSPSSAAQPRMFIQPHEFGIEEHNADLGLTIRVDYFTLAEAPVAGLLRRVSICNTRAQTRHLQLVDGLPQVLPYGLNQWLVKFMSRTSEAFVRTEFAQPDLPFYRLRVWPTDSPQVAPVIAGHFFVGFAQGKRHAAIVDPNLVFGLANDFSEAQGFFDTAELDLQQQILGNQMPAAMQQLNLTLEAGQSSVFYGLYGHAENLDVLNAFIATVDDEYVERKRAQNQSLIQQLCRPATSVTALPLLDGHARQCYLDNGLRGGFSQRVPGNTHLYLFGRKHGDLERDYNDFLLQDGPYSEGNGDFRDMLQNRRLDVWFNPEIDHKSIRYFFNLVQADGYNPCQLRNLRYRVEQPQHLPASILQIPGLHELVQTEFKYADLWRLALSQPQPDDVMQQVLSQSHDIEDAEFDRGYWSDHWTYLLDLLLSYQAVFPDRLLQQLLATEYAFFDPTHRVLPRQRKYHLTAQGIRQYDSVQPDPAKKRLIESRTQQRFRARSQHGHGVVVYVSLLGKILTLIVNKLSTLDPFGVGIEMEADRPGWCDALNGLPGVLGSSVNETIELQRLIAFTREQLQDQQVDCDLPIELSGFIRQINVLLAQNLEPFAFWRESGAIKEAYREQIFMGFDGALDALPQRELSQFLQAAERHVADAVNRAERPYGIATYFRYQVSQYREQDDGIEALAFEQSELPLFLEGFVHAMRIADAEQAQTLYAAARNSALYDEKLGMYRLNVPLGEQALDYGRIGVFHYGWLENGSIFLHMHYKWILEWLRNGLYDAFYQQLTQTVVAFHDPQIYGRNPLENSSFVVSSGFSADPAQHGRGCVARLSGSTVEFLHMWLLLFLGQQPFVVQDGELRFQPAPMLARHLFIDQPSQLQLFDNEYTLPAHSAACVLFGSTLLVYLNPQQADCFGTQAVKPVSYTLYAANGRQLTIRQAYLERSVALEIRQGLWQRIDVELA